MSDNDMYLRETLNRVEEFNTPAGRYQLLANLVREGASVSETEAGWTIEIFGVSVTEPGTSQAALEAWCTAARLSLTA